MEWRPPSSRMHGKNAALVARNGAGTNRSRNILNGNANLDLCGVCSILRVGGGGRRTWLPSNVTFVRRSLKYEVTFACTTLNM